MYIYEATRHLKFRYISILIYIYIYIYIHTHTHTHTLLNNLMSNVLGY